MAAENVYAGVEVLAVTLHLHVELPLQPLPLGLVGAPQQLLAAAGAHEPVTGADSSGDPTRAVFLLGAAVAIITTALIVRA